MLRLALTWIERGQLKVGPAAVAREAARRELSEIRKKAWATRRKKYGKKGHR